MSIFALQERPEQLNPRQIRSSGLIPVTVYGKELKESLSLALNKKDFETKLGYSRYVRLVSVEVRGKETMLLIRFTETHPLTDEVLNIQFQHVTPEQTIKATLPVSFVGVSPMTQAGGSLKLVHRRVNISCPAAKLPLKLEFDLALLAGSKHLAYYSDLTLPDGATLLSIPKQIIAKISMPQVVAA